MMIDLLIDKVKEKKNPCIVGLDPDPEKLPPCYRAAGESAAEGILNWNMDLIDTLWDIIPAVKPQLAFYEKYGSRGMEVFEKTVAYAQENGLFVIDDSKRGDIGNTARAYAAAHLSKEGPIHADFMTVSPFLGRDSIKPFVETAVINGKGIFLLVKTSNPDSEEISKAKTESGETVSDALAGYLSEISKEYVGKYGYSAIGAVVGATYPKEAKRLRERMRHNLFLVPGYGAQGGDAKSVLACFNEDGLGALVSSSREILYHYQKEPDYDGSREMYLQIVREQACAMQKAVYDSLKRSCPQMDY